MAGRDWGPRYAPGALLSSGGTPGWALCEGSAASPSHPAAPCCLPHLSHFPQTVFFLITQPLRTTHILFAATDALLPQFSFSR